MKEILNDYIHLTQMEFLLKHPFVVIGIWACAVGLMFAIDKIVDYIRRNKK